MSALGQKRTSANKLGGCHDGLAACAHKNYDFLRYGQRRIERLCVLLTGRFDCSAWASINMSKPKTDTVEIMTDKQAVLLRELAIDTYEPEAFRPEFDQGRGRTSHQRSQSKIKTYG